MKGGEEVLLSKYQDVMEMSREEAEDALVQALDRRTVMIIGAIVAALCDRGDYAIVAKVMLDKAHSNPSARTEASMLLEQYKEGFSESDPALNKNGISLASSFEDYK